MTENPMRFPSHGYDLAETIFKVEGDDLIVGGVALRDIVQQAGTPSYIYDAGIIRQTYRSFAGMLKGFARVHYSVKANPHLDVIRLLVQEGAGIEIASIGEYRAAIAAGAAPESILFAGPGKRQQELEEVIQGGIGEIHVESLEEIERIEAIGKPVKASVRINPVPTVQAGAMRMGGKPTAFGFDEEDIGIAIAALGKARNIELVGVHIYGGTQILDSQALIGQWRHAIGLASQIAAMTGKPLKTVDLGGGLGIPYHAGDQPLDMAKVAEAIPSLISAMKNDPLLAHAHAIVEPGRYLVGSAGIYVSEINAVKQSRGTRFLVTDGGMHHHLAASGNLGQVIKRSYPVIAPARMSDRKMSPATIAGPLCTPLDTLARDVMLPELKSGDLVAVLQSGAYGRTASPVNFLSHDAPSEVMVESGRILSVSRP